MQKGAIALSDSSQRLFTALLVLFLQGVGEACGARRFGFFDAGCSQRSEGADSFAAQTTSYMMRPAMQQIEIQEYAQQLLETHGDKAVVVAAKKACSFEEGGNSKEAKTWRHIEAALKLMRWPKES